MSKSSLTSPAEAGTLIGGPGSRESGAAPDLDPALLPFVPEYEEPEPATAAEAWAALSREGPAADAVRSYLAPGPQPRYDTPQARARAGAQADREAGQ